MVEKGKRSYSRPHKDYDGDNRNQKRRVNDRDERGDGELIVYRILCPDRVIGSVIGKSGKIINSIRQESRAKVKVVDPFPGANDRVLTIYCYVNDKVDLEVDDEFNDTEALCAAQQALLMVHTAISNAVASIGDSDKKQRDDECQLLVPISQSANIIGKSGSTIKKLRSKTRTNIRVTSKDASDPKHSCAMHFDNFIQINGESDAVKKALFAISAIMYKFGPKENISLDTSVPEVPPTIIISSDVPVYPAAGFYPGVDSIVNPRSLSSILGATHVPELQGYADTEISWPGYSSSVPVVSRYGGASRSEELIIRVLCSFSKIGRVIGKGGASIKSVRNASGARVGVDDKKTDHNECTITVTATEKLDDVKSMAVEAVLLLQEKINDEDADTVSIRLLIPSKVIGCIIGKNGSIINEIRKRTKADIRISKGDKPKCADDDDELVEVFGEVGSVRDALVQIVLRLRDDVLKDREVNQNPSDGVGLRSLYPGSTAFSVPPVLPGIPPVGLLGYEQRGDTGSGLNMVTSDSLYRYESLPTGDSSYGSLSSPYSSKLYGGLPRATALEMVVPAHALGKVMGKGGANLDNIRKGDKIVDDVCPNMPLDDSSFDFKPGRSLLGGLNSNSLGLLRMSPETTCCDLLSQQTRTFIQMGTKLKVADNSGAKLVKCIQALKGKKGARLGDMIVASVKEAAPGGTVKKGAVVYAVVVRAAMPRGRCDGSEVKFDDNACVLVNKQGEPIGKRVHGPVPHELRKKKHIKILSLAEHIA